MSLITTIATATLIPTAMIVIAHLLPQTNPNLEKLSPYECGFNPTQSTRLPFSLQFFLVAVFFLLFDLEIALLLPIPWALNTDPTTTMALTATMITLLAIGLAHEWTQGALEWSK
uniref:NADH-ubiquinone oxidoreductase chain 3 n=1 Tax=Uromastyx benti TaxID=236742 RepID=D6RR66_9SAUR|nr:NADH dehydrogenase subunit 3 [Uromastyx benti]BAJ08054.1 NADH dehydrogenase subunit 3 [Uromastyx benti]